MLITGKEALLYQANRLQLQAEMTEHYAPEFARVVREEAQELIRRYKELQDAKPRS